MAMTIPVIHSFHIAFPDIRISVLTKGEYVPLFKLIGVQAIVAKTKDTHKGISGLFKLFKEIRKEETAIDCVADLHNVLRSKVFRFLFMLSGTKTASLDKGRTGLKQLTRKTDKIIQPLASRFERYQDVFAKLGFKFELNFSSVYASLPILNNRILDYSGEKKERWIGVAPFAAFTPKIYPLNEMKLVIKHLSADPQNKIFFFGGGAAETAILNEWEGEFRGSVNMSGKLDLADELQLMSHLTVMVAMDSANMHFASLVNVPVISIWGATHPYSGFAGWAQKEKNQVQIDLYCRPCSVFGNVPCYRGDHACMNKLPASTILQKVLDHLRQINLNH